MKKLFFPITALVWKLLSREPRTLALLLGGLKYFGAWKYINVQIKEYLADGRVIEEEVGEVWVRTTQRIERGITVQGLKAAATGDLTKFWRARMLRASR